MSKPRANAGPGRAKAPARSAEETMLLAGLTAFHTHHQATYKSRWLTSLYPSLLLQHPSVAVLNRHLGSRALDKIRASLRERGAKKWERGNPGEVECWRFEDEESADAAAKVDAIAISGDADEPTMTSRFLPPKPFDINVSQLLPYYLLDGASVLAVDAMSVGPHHAVLDLCAAPGGKSIVAAQALDLLDQEVPAKAAAAPSSSSTAASSSSKALASLALTQPLGTLHSNEPQATRRTRLQNVLSEYLPETVRRNRTRVEVTGWDATKVTLPALRYDRVLVDAPCSSDRHVLSNSKELASWTTKRIHSNAERQELLLLNALKSVKIGGIVVYCTCSLSRRENDQVVANVLERMAKSKKNAAKNCAQRVNVQVLKIRLTGTQPASSAVPSSSDAAASASSSSATASTGASASITSGLASEEDDVLYLPLGEPTKYGWMVLPDQVAVQLTPTAASTATPAESATAAAPTPSSEHEVASSTAASSAGSSAASAKAPAPAVGHGFGPLFFCRLKRISNVAAGDAAQEAEEGEEEDESEEEDSASEEEDEEESDEETKKDAESNPRKK